MLALVFQSDIVDVNTIFKELATMVHEQGEVIDSIEANVESAQMRVEEGTTQLATAASYQVRQLGYQLPEQSVTGMISFQSKLRRRKCILAIIGAVVLAILIGIIVWQTK